MAWERRSAGWNVQLPNTAYLQRVRGGVMVLLLLEAHTQGMGDTNQSPEIPAEPGDGITYGLGGREVEKGPACFSRFESTTGHQRL